MKAGHHSSFYSLQGNEDLSWFLERSRGLFPQHNLYSWTGVPFLFARLPSPLAPSFSPNEQANLSCAMSGGFCGRCSGRARLFFIMALVQRGSTKDHGTWSSEHWLGMRHVYLLVIRNYPRRMLRCAQEIICLTSFLFDCEQVKELFRFST